MQTYTTTTPPRGKDHKYNSANHCIEVTCKECTNTFCIRCEGPRCPNCQAPFNYKLN